MAIGSGKGAGPGMGAGGFGDSQYGGMVEQRRRALEASQAGLQQAGVGASTARANADKSHLQGEGIGLGVFEQEHQATHAGDIASQARTQQAGFGTQQRIQESELQAGAEQRRMDMFKPFLDRFTSEGGGGGPTPQHVDFGGLSGAEDAAQSAAFARAKDQAGLIGRSASNSLAGVMGARGLTGSGLAANAAGGVINQQATQLGNVNREQAIQGANMARQRASEQYQGNITQRGQDIAANDSRRNAMLGLVQGFQGNITARY